MHTRTLKSLAAIAACAALAASAPLALAQQKTTQPPKYYVINLGDPLGVPSAAAASINPYIWCCPMTSMIAERSWALPPIQARTRLWRSLRFPSMQAAGTQRILRAPLEE